MADVPDDVYGYFDIFCIVTQVKSQLSILSLNVLRTFIKINVTAGD